MSLQQLPPALRSLLRTRRWATAATGALREEVALPRWVLHGLRKDLLATGQLRCMMSGHPATTAARQTRLSLVECFELPHRSEVLSSGLLPLQAHRRHAAVLTKGSL